MIKHWSFEPGLSIFGWDLHLETRNLATSWSHPATFGQQKSRSIVSGYGKFLYTNIYRTGPCSYIYIYGRQHTHVCCYSKGMCCSVVYQSGKPKKTCSKFQMYFFRFWILLAFHDPEPITLVFFWEPPAFSSSGCHVAVTGHHNFPGEEAPPSTWAPNSGFFWATESWILCFIPPNADWCNSNIRKKWDCNILWVASKGIYQLNFGLHTEQLEWFI